MRRDSIMRCVRFSGWLTLLLAASVVRAQTDLPPIEEAPEEQPSGEDVVDEADTAEAIRLSELGRLHYDGGEFAEAAAAFSRAFELHPEPVLGYNAGRSYENAGEPEPALELYQATLALPFDDDDLRRRCQDGVTRIENILARVEAARLATPARVTVESNPTGASVYLDGEPVGRAPAVVERPAGEFRIRLELDGYEPHEEIAALEPAQVLALRVDLRELPSQPPPEGGPNWLAVGLTAGAGAGLVLLGALSAVGARESYAEAQTADVLRDDARFAETVDQGERQKIASTVFYGIGAFTLGVAVLLYFITDDRPDDDAAVDVTSGPGDIGAGVRWTF